MMYSAWTSHGSGCGRGRNRYCDNYRNRYCNRYCDGYRNSDNPSGGAT